MQGVRTKTQAQAHNEHADPLVHGSKCSTLGCKLLHVLIRNPALSTPSSATETATAAPATTKAAAPTPAAATKPAAPASTKATATTPAAKTTTAPASETTTTPAAPAITTPTTPTPATTTATTRPTRTLWLGQESFQRQQLHRINEKLLSAGIAAGRHALCHLDGEKLRAAAGGSSNVLRYGVYYVGLYGAQAARSSHVCVHAADAVVVALVQLR
jgi:hypothetical protein